MNMKESEKKFASFRKFKIVQAVVMVLLEIGFIIILVADPVFRNSLYTNKTLFILSAMMWILMLFSLICIYIDIKKMEVLSKDNAGLVRMLNDKMQE